MTKLIWFNWEPQDQPVYLCILIATDNVCFPDIPENKDSLLMWKTRLCGCTGWPITLMVAPASKHFFFRVTALKPMNQDLFDLGFTYFKLGQSVQQTRVLWALLLEILGVYLLYEWSEQESNPQEWGIKWLNLSTLDILPQGVFLCHGSISHMFKYFVQTKIFKNLPCRGRAEHPQSHLL